MAILWIGTVLASWYAATRWSVFDEDLRMCADVYETHCKPAVAVSLRRVSMLTNLSKTAIELSLLKCKRHCFPTEPAQGPKGPPRRPPPTPRAQPAGPAATKEKEKAEQD
jgi:hypothetical protein